MQVLRPKRTFCKANVPNKELSRLRHVVRYWVKYGFCRRAHKLINRRVRVDFKTESS